MRERERKWERDDDAGDDDDDYDETLFKHDIYISKNTALQKSREILINSETIDMPFKSRERDSRPDVVWDRVPYLYSYKGKTTAFGKFSVVFR